MRRPRSVRRPPAYIPSGSVGPQHPNTLYTHYDLGKGHGGLSRGPVACGGGRSSGTAGGSSAGTDCTPKPTPAHNGVSAGRWWCAVNAADRVIRWSTALAVVGVAAVAAVVSYEHACALVRAHGESGWTGRLIPLTVDGLIYASSTVMLDSARRGARVPSLARWLLGLGIVATLAANVAHGLGHGIIGAAVAAWPAVALVGSYELLMVIIHGAQPPAGAPRPHAGVPMVDPLGEQAVMVFAAELAADQVPSVRAIRAALHVGQPRAQRLREYLAGAAGVHDGSLAA